MIRHAVVSLSLASLLAACSSADTRLKANGDFEYVNVELREPLKIPEGADRPNFSEDYQIPEVGQEAPPVIGDNLQVASPALVLPTVSGSHIEEGSKDSVVWLDKVNDDQPLDSQIWENVIGYLEESGVGVEYFSKDEQKLVTDWIVFDELEESAWYDWTKEERTIARRFELSLELKPHGRSAALSSKLIDFKETVNGELVADMNTADIRRNQADILNRILNHYDYQVRLANANRVQQIRQGLEMELGFNAKGEPAFIVQGEYQIAWPRLLLVFRKLGFNVTDLDQTAGILYVDYEGPEEGWWASMWSSEETLKLDTESYHIIVGDLGNQTSVTFLNEDDEPFEAQALKDIFEPFSVVMTEDNLDI